MAVTQTRIKFADLVKETTTTTGTGSIALGGAPTGFQTFVAGIGDYGPCFYAITLDSEWEVGFGKIISPNLLRVKVFASSNSGNLVSFSAGTKVVRHVNPAESLIDTTRVVHTAQTTDATQTTMTVYGASEYEQLIWTDTTMVVHFTIAVRQSAGSAGTVGDTFTAKYSALIKNVSNTVTLVSGPTEITGYSHEDSALTTLAVDLTVTGSVLTLQIKVTGMVDKTLDWKAYVEVFEVD